MAGEIIFFSLAGPVGYHTGNIIYQSLGGPWSSGKIYAPGNPSSGCPWLSRNNLRNVYFKGLKLTQKNIGVFSVYFVERISEAAMGGRRSSFGVQRSSEGYSIAQKGAAYLRRVQLIQSVQRSS
jgi:hypothetical protein